MKPKQPEPEQPKQPEPDPAVRAHEIARWLVVEAVSAERERCAALAARMGQLHVAREIRRGHDG